MEVKAIETFKVYENPKGPKISTVSRKVIEKSKLYFKDIDGSGKVSKVNDWRLPAEDRAAAYVKKLTLEEKRGLLVISDLGMENASVEEITEYINKLQTEAEEKDRFIPVQVASNSRNEYGKALFCMEGTGSILPTWPGTLGIAAAARGDSVKVVDQYAEAIRRSWNAVGLRKGYLYASDVVTDPKSQKACGTFGEDSKLTKKVISHMITRVQGSKASVTTDGVAILEKLAVSNDSENTEPLDTEALNSAATEVLTEMFALGMFEDTYRDVEEAKKVVATQKDWDNAYAAHLKSVTVLKNDWVLPLTPEATWQKNVYAEAFHKDPEMADKLTYELRTMLPQINQVYNPKDADYAFLMLYPCSDATDEGLDLNICEETTLTGLGRIRYIADTVHANYGRVIMNINFIRPWMVRDIESYADALTASFNTYPQAVLDVIRGLYAPTGKLPFTLPRGEEVFAVNEKGKCISRSDVPGYNKDKYMPDEMKDENGKAYAYRDGHGNYYELDFGLRW